MNPSAAAVPLPNFRNLGQQFRSAILGAIALGITLALLCSAAGALIGATFALLGPFPDSYGLPTNHASLLVSGLVNGEVIGGLCGAVGGAFQGLLWGVALWKSPVLARRLVAVARGSARGTLGGAWLGGIGGVIACILLGAFCYLWLNVALPAIWVGATSRSYGWWDCAQFGAGAGALSGAFFGAGIGARLDLHGTSASALAARLARLGKLAGPLAACFAPPAAAEESSNLDAATTSLPMTIRTIVPLRYIPPLGFFHAVALLMFIHCIGTGLSWDELKIPLACVGLGWLCGWVRRPAMLREAALHPPDARDRPNFLLNILCFVLPPLGLASWLALDNRWPRRARSAGRSAVRGAVLMYAVWQLAVIWMLVSIACRAIAYARLTPNDALRTESHILKKQAQRYARLHIARSPVKYRFATQREPTLVDSVRCRIAYPVWALQSGFKTAGAGIYTTSSVLRPMHM